jgi:hypothetical protein
VDGFRYANSVAPDVLSHAMVITHRVKHLGIVRNLGSAHACLDQLGDALSVSLVNVKGKDGSHFPLQLPLSPMRLFAIGLEFPHDVPMQRLQYTNPRHHGVTAPAAQQQSFDRSLPFRQAGYPLRRASDINRGVSEGDEFPTIRVDDRFIEWCGPAQWRQPSLSTSVLKPDGIRGLAASFTALHIGHGAPAPPQPQACGPSHGLSGCLSQTQPQSSQRAHFMDNIRRRGSESPATMPGERNYTFGNESEILKQSSTAVYP